MAILCGMPAVEFIHGCDCISQDEFDVLIAEDVDSLEYQALAYGLEAEARQRCLQVAAGQGLVESNCLTAMTLEGEIFKDRSDCVAGCVYTRELGNRGAPPSEFFGPGDKS